MQLACGCGDGARYMQLACGDGDGAMFRLDQCEAVTLEAYSHAIHVAVRWRSNCEQFC